MLPLSSKFFPWLEALSAANSLIAIGLFFGVWAIAWLPLAVPLAWKLKWQPFNPLTLKQKLTFLAALYVAAPGAVWLALGWEGLSWADCGLSWGPAFWLSLGAGLALGLGGLALTFVPQGWLGWLVWHPDRTPRLWSVSPSLLGGALAVGFVEELVFRGFCLTLLQQDHSPWVAAGLASGIFAALHLVWGEAGTVPQLPGLWLMGMVLALARGSDGGSLGLAWGLHAAWLWGLWALEAAGLFSYTGKGSVWLTGWGGQPLAGLSGIACLVGTGGLLWGISGLLL